VISQAIKVFGHSTWQALWRLIVIIVSLSVTSPSNAQSLDLSWHTVDGGGACPPTASVGGTFELSGTIGQHDAGSFTQPMTGGTFSLVGGFWVIATPVAPPACACPGDMNVDGQKDGRDIQNFATCLVEGGDCGCAEMDASPGLTFADVTVFVSDLLNDVACP